MGVKKMGRREGGGEKGKERSNRALLQVVVSLLDL